jgi:hypothetical protein
MYDLAKWQSTFRIHKPDARILRALGRYTGTGQYAGIPAALEGKTQTSDPVSIWAPDRFFIVSNTVDIEFIDSDPNFIVEDVDPDPDVVREESTLDTLYRVFASVLPDPQPPNTAPDFLERNPKFVIMTNYQGPAPDYTNVIHSGFPLWWIQQTQSKQLVDYVLQTLWGLSPKEWPGNPPMLAQRAPQPAVGAPAVPEPTGTARRAPGRGNAKPAAPPTTLRD